MYQMNVRNDNSCGIFAVILRSGITLMLDEIIKPCSRARKGWLALQGFGLRQ
jgi:hypothetical protein